MTYAIGNLITDVITLRDESNVPILGLEEDDFAIFEAYLVTTPATVEIVALTEINEGQYSIEFTPGVFGPWAFHYVYDSTPVFREDTRIYTVESSAEIVVITAGGTWTYDGDLTDPIQEVRFLIQDTDASNPLFVDTDVSYALGLSTNNVRRAAIFLVERLLVRYSAMADTTELDLSVRASQLYENASGLLKILKNPFFATSTVVPYAGGISYIDIEAGEANTDRVIGVFDRGIPARSRNWGGIV